MNLEQKGENLAYHAARILILIAYCGKPRRATSAVLPAIEGRTLLAKLDFFLRYPAYLKKAAEIRTAKSADFRLLDGSANEATSVESRMVRYLYGPWDHLYYPVLAYLIGKQLISVEKGRASDVFRLTAQGREVATRLAQDPAYKDQVQRAELVYRLFNAYSGNRLKEFIYEHFPEVVNRGVGSTI
jgi:hypothetical protein